MNKMKKAKTHIRYKNDNGIHVPGVTTVTGVMNKPALVPWANRLGLQGYEVGKWVDELSTIGTLAHYLTETHIKNLITTDGPLVEPNLDDYTPNQIKRAEKGFEKFLRWESENKVEYIFSEKVLISEKYQYGGTLDIYCKLNDVLTLVDLKTCKAVYPEHFTQVAGGYEPLLTENGFPVEDSRILRIGRDETEGFDDVRIPNRKLHQERFLICKKLYDINKKCK